MSNVELLNPVRLRREYGFTLLAATAAAGVAGGALWLANNGKVSSPLLWQVGAAAATVGAVALTVAAIRTARRMVRLREVAEAFDAAGRGEEAERSTGLFDSIVEGLRRSAEAMQAEQAAARARSETEPPRNSVEGERVRLRKAGFTDAEISQILIARETGQSGGFNVHGVLTGVLNNLTAVMGHARNFVPGLKADIANVLAPRSSFGQRIGGAVNLALKACVIGVLVYVVQLEFVQLRAMVEKTKAEACSAKAKNILDSVPMNRIGEAVELLAKECAPAP